MIPVVAFHGDFAQPSHLQEDAGNPSWIDQYETYNADRDYINPATLALVKRLQTFDKLILVGYSRGGDLIAWLSHRLQNIVAAVLYEAPVLVVRPRPMAVFPVLQIWNEDSLKEYRFWRFLRNRRRAIALESVAAWGVGRKSEPLVGGGGHIKKVQRPPFNRGHGWDVSLNEQIGQWVREHRANG